LFGYSVAIRGNTAIVGGSAYLFDTTTGQEVHKLRTSDPAAQQWLGDGVAMNSKTAVVGTSGENANIGAVYQFDLTTGQEVRKFTAPPTFGGRYFGISVAMNERTVLIGAHDHDVGREDNAGLVYAFDATTGELISTLHASDWSIGAEFGISVAIRGQKAIVGARYQEPGGAVYILDLSRGPSIDGDF
jgi:outer membrane protein assembly factor BamB